MSEILTSWVCRELADNESYLSEISARFVPGVASQLYLCLSIDQQELLFSSWTIYLTGRRSLWGNNSPSPDCLWAKLWQGLNQSWHLNPQKSSYEPMNTHTIWKTEGKLGMNSTGCRILVMSILHRRNVSRPFLPLLYSVLKSQKVNGAKTTKIKEIPLLKVMYLRSEIKLILCRTSHLEMPPSNSWR